MLARPRWGAFLAWQVAEVGYFLAFYGELLGAAGKPVFPEGVFVLASTLRWSRGGALRLRRPGDPATRSWTRSAPPTPTTRTAASSTARRIPDAPLAVEPAARTRYRPGREPTRRRAHRVARPAVARLAARRSEAVDHGVADVLAA